MLTDLGTTVSPTVCRRSSPSSPPRREYHLCEPTFYFYFIPLLSSPLTHSSSMKIKLVSPPERKYSVWIGGSICLSLVANEVSGISLLTFHSGLYVSAMLCFGDAVVAVSSGVSLGLPANVPQRSPPSSRCGSRSRSTTSRDLPLSTASASKCATSKRRRRRHTKQRVTEHVAEWVYSASYVFKDDAKYDDGSRTTNGWWLGLACRGR